MATAGELAKAPLPPQRDSISFVPTLLGDAASQPKHPFLYWEFHEGGFKQAALYQGRWKGIRNREPEAPIALYDLHTDIAEQHDVRESHPQIARIIGDYLRTARLASSDWEPQWTTPGAKKP
jgi:arylsulfatase A-like enzyme